MCSTADSLILTQYERCSRHFNFHRKCAVEKTVQFSHNICCIADSLMLTKLCGTEDKFILTKNERVSR
jgi:hypothetical protein